MTSAVASSPSSFSGPPLNMVRPIPYDPETLLPEFEVDFENEESLASLGEKRKSRESSRRNSALTKYEQAHRPISAVSHLSGISHAADDSTAEPSPWEESKQNDHDQVEMGVIDHFPPPPPSQYQLQQPQSSQQKRQIQNHTPTRLQPNSYARSGVTSPSRAATVQRPRTQPAYQLPQTAPRPSTSPHGATYHTSPRRPHTTSTGRTSSNRRLFTFSSSQPQVTPPLSPASPLAREMHRAIYSQQLYTTVQDSPIRNHEVHLGSPMRSQELTIRPYPQVVDPTVTPARIQAELESMTRIDAVIRRKMDDLRRIKTGTHMNVLDSLYVNANGAFPHPKSPTKPASPSRVHRSRDDPVAGHLTRHLFSASLKLERIRAQHAEVLERERVKREEAEVRWLEQEARRREWRRQEKQEARRQDELRRERREEWERLHAAAQERRQKEKADEEERERQEKERKKAERIKQHQFMRAEAERLASPTTSPSSSQSPPIIHKSPADRAREQEEAKERDRLKAEQHWTRTQELWKRQEADLLKVKQEREAKEAREKQEAEEHRREIEHKARQLVQERVKEQIQQMQEASEATKKAQEEQQRKTEEHERRSAEHYTRVRDAMAEEARRKNEERLAHEREAEEREREEAVQKARTIQMIASRPYRQAIREHSRSSRRSLHGSSRNSSRSGSKSPSRTESPGFPARFNSPPTDSALTSSAISPSPSPPPKQLVISASPNDSPRSSAGFVHPLSPSSSPSSYQSQPSSSPSNSNGPPSTQPPLTSPKASRSFASTRSGRGYSPRKKTSMVQEELNQDDQ